MTFYAKIDIDKSTILDVLTLDEDAARNANTDPERGKPFLLPVIDDKPDLADGEEYAGFSYVIEAKQVQRVWATRAIPEPEPDAFEVLHDRVVTLEKENAALKDALIKKEVVSQEEIEAEKPKDVKVKGATS